MRIERNFALLSIDSVDNLAANVKVHAGRSVGQREEEEEEDGLVSNYLAIRNREEDVAARLNSVDSVDQ